MIGLVMCGGKGTRMESVQEKLLLKYKKPVVQHVISALEESGCFTKIICATSRNAPKTAEFVRGLGMQTIETGGNGYVEDLSEALKNFSEHVFVVSGDLALLDSEIVQKIVNHFEGRQPWASVLASKKFLDLVGVKPEYLVIYDGKECAFTGISIVNPRDVVDMKSVRESYIIIDDKRVAINLNTKRDFELLGTA
ncbi:MAG: NTP transferase domain-containing protein [Thaumarchaeota archaeon]|nr:NTP transferase domain-containing protein [Nitrososphaerota archaeon]